MSGFSVLMFIYGILTLAMGYYMYTGHPVKGLSWQAPYKNLDKEGWIRIGKGTIFASFLIFLLALLGILFHF